MQATVLIALASIYWCARGQLCKPVTADPGNESKMQRALFVRLFICVCDRGCIFPSPEEDNWQSNSRADYDYQNNFIKPFTCTTETAINTSIST